MMNEYLQDLFISFSKVHHRYYFTQVFRNMGNFDQVQEAVIQSTENSYTAELFRHWRNIMESASKERAYENLALDFDVRKNWFERLIITYESESYRPDLVLHLSQLNWDPDFQKVYVEVKTKPNPYVKDDIQKIANAVHCLNFERGVFISVNSNLEVLKELIKNIVIAENRRLIQQQIHIDWDRIFLFHSIIDNGINNISKPISFSEIII